MNLVRKCDQLISGLSLRLSQLGGVLLIFVAMLMCIDIFLRNINQTVMGNLEIVQVAFLAACFFGFAQSHANGSAICIDVLKANVRPRIRATFGIVGKFVSLLFYGFLLIDGFSKFLRAWNEGIFMGGHLSLPMTLPWGAFVVGSAIASVVIFRDFIVEVIVAMTGKMVSREHSSRPLAVDPGNDAKQ